MNKEQREKISEGMKRYYHNKKLAQRVAELKKAKPVLKKAKPVKEDDKRTIKELSDRLIEVNNDNFRLRTELDNAQRDLIKVKVKAMAFDLLYLIMTKMGG